MKTWPMLYHLARADFFERSRRYSFLITIGVTLYIAYVYLPPQDAAYLGFSLGEVRGVYNSAWIGSIIAVLCSTLLIVPGFYLVKNAIVRDIDTHVGEIIATTPIRNWGYTTGKTLSNFAYLTAMVGVIAIAGIAMQLIRGEVLRIEIWPYFAPFIFAALPAMFIISALAVLFEAIPWLRGGFGNIVYACLWLIVLITSIALSESSGSLRATSDPLGMTPIVYSMLETARVQFPGVESGFAIGGIAVQGPAQTFVWNGVQWTAQAVLQRFIWIGVAIGLVMLAALLFNRFDPASERWKGKKTKAAETADNDILPMPTPPLVSQARLTALESRRGFPLSAFGRTLLAELRLMLKGIPWWWYLVAFGLVIACLFAPLNVAHQYLLPAAWVWPVLFWSTMGNREVRHRTNQLVFSVAYPLRQQLPASWIAGWILALAAGGGLAVRLIAAGQREELFAWVVGSAFIPTLAIALGIWSGSSKLFEVVYILLWYAGPTNRVAFLDYMGVTEGALALGIPWYFLALTVLLLILAMIGRRWRIHI